MDSSPKEKLICVRCGYETDYLGTYAKPPVCPACKNFLSFKDSGAISPEEAEVVPWVSLTLKALGLVFLMTALGFIFWHFKTSDSRALVKEQVRIGEKFYGGKTRSKIAAEWALMPYSFDRYWAHNFTSRTSVMLDEEHSYIYKGSRGGQMEIEYLYSDSKGKKGGKILLLNLAGNAAFLDIPPVPYVSKSSPKRLKLVQDASGRQIRVSQT